MQEARISFFSYPGKSGYCGNYLFASGFGQFEWMSDCFEKGFSAVKRQLENEPVAISFAFPGPADYKNGVIGDLPNFPVFVEVWLWELFWKKNLVFRYI